MLEQVKQLPGELAQEASSLQTGLTQEARSARSQLGPLLTGVVEDASRLMRQELALAQAEMRRELVTAKAAAAGLGATAALAQIALLLLALAFVQLLVYMFPSLPFFAAYLVAAVVVAGGAGALYFSTQETLANLDLVPRQTLQTMKENARWLIAKAKI